MEIMLIAVGVLLVVGLVLRLVMGPDALGNWVDRVNESPPWFPFEGSASESDHDSKYDGE